MSVGSARALVSAMVFVLLALVAPAAASAADAPAAPTDLRVRHANGQTFITWTERPELSGEVYRILRSSGPITDETVATATVLATVGEGSSRIWSDRWHRGRGWQWRFTPRAVIKRLGDPLSARTGLLVWTPSPSDLGKAGEGEGYYAVVTQVADQQSALVASGPVLEHVEAPAPVLTRSHRRGRVTVWTQFMDVRTWNGTFHAPRAGNKWLGFDADAPGIANALSFAHRYVIAFPDPSVCPRGRVPRRLPVTVLLHGRSGARKPADLGPTTWCAIELRATDDGATRWFGFAVGNDYRSTPIPGPGDRIANYTEERVLRMLFDLFRDPDLGPRVDRDRVYVMGGSMGGTGTLSFAMRYPAVFAAAYAWVPLADYATAPASLRRDVVPRWGAIEDDLPVRIDGPGDWARHLEGYEGVGVWTWQDHIRGTVVRRGEDNAPLGLAHGRQDPVATWKTQAAPFYAQLQRSARSFAGAIKAAAHRPLLGARLLDPDPRYEDIGFAGLPAALRLRDGVPFFGLRAVRTETVPGLSEDPKHPRPWPPKGEAAINIAIEWSASWNPWDGRPVDRPGRWAMSLRSRDSRLYHVQVTPRRVQRFRVVPGATYRFTVRRIKDRAVLATGKVVADPDGLLSVRVPVGATGVRLSIWRP